jgi:hypothetical protein
MFNIYLICAEINGEKLHKIGYTRRTVEQRIKEFKTGNASEFYIVESFRSEWGTKIEASLKRIYKMYNVRGEWFMLPDNEIINFKKKCIELHNNFEFLSNNNSFIIDNGWI